MDINKKSLIKLLTKCSMLNHVSVVVKDKKYIADKNYWCYPYAGQSISLCGRVDSILGNALYLFVDNKRLFINKQNGNRLFAVGLHNLDIKKTLELNGIAFNKLGW